MSDYIMGAEIPATYEQYEDRTSIIIRSYEVEVDLPHGLGEIKLDRQELEEKLAEAKEKELAQASQS